MPSRPTASVRATLVAAMVAVLGLLLASPAQAAAVSAGEHRNLAFDVTLDTVYKQEHTHGKTAYGVTILTGTTRVKNRVVQLERISTYQFTKGSGPIGGFFSMTWADGSHLAFSVTGQSEMTSTKRTGIIGTMRVIEATGRFTGFTGAGVFDGERRGPIGTPVTYSFSVRLTK